MKIRLIDKLYLFWYKAFSKMDYSQFIVKQTTNNDTISSFIESQVKKMEKPNSPHIAKNIQILYGKYQIGFTQKMVGTGKPNCPFPVIICLIDTSNSTDNFNPTTDGYDPSLSIARNDKLDLSRMDCALATKPIIMAEIECVMHALEELMTLFNMKNVKLVLIPFSQTFSVFEHVAESNGSLCTCINSNIWNLPYDKHTTHLVNPIKYLEQNYFLPNTRNLCIVATDGQPEEKAQVLKLIDQNRKFFELIVIGAGSIGLFAHNTLTFRGQNVMDIDFKGINKLVTTGEISADDVRFMEKIRDKNLQNIQKGKLDTECDYYFLKSLGGLYVGAYGDYSDAILDINNYLQLLTRATALTPQIVNNTDEKQFCSMGTDGPIRYDNFIQNALNNGSYAVSMTNGEGYLITPKWQVAIKTSDNQLAFKSIDVHINFVVASIDSGLTFADMSFQTMSELKFSKPKKIKLIVKDRKAKVKMCIDDKGHLKVRPVNKIKL